MVWLIDCMVFNTIFNIISVITCRPVHLSMLSLSSLTNTLRNIFSKPLNAFKYNNHCHNNEQCSWERNKSCCNDYHQSCPAWMAQWWAYRTHDPVVVSLKPGRGKISFRHIFASHLYWSMWEKVVSGFGKKLCVSTGVRKPENMTAMIWPQYNQQINLQRVCWLSRWSNQQTHVLMSCMLPTQLWGLFDKTTSSVWLTWCNLSW